MSNWGLLGGIGRGLNQFGSTVHQGMSADITAEKQQEADLKRQSSIEKRWARQDAQQEARDLKTDARHAEDKTWRENKSNDDKAWREGRAKVGDAQNERSMKLRETQSIESNMSGILSAKQKAESDIYQRYQKQAKDPMGMPLQGEALAQLNQAMQEEIKGVRSQYGTLLEQRIASYGDRLRGTGYAYLLDVPDIQEVETPTEPTNSEPNITDTSNQQVDNYFNQIVNEQLTEQQPEQQPKAQSEDVYFGDPRAKDINAYQSIGRTIGNILPIKAIDDEQMNNSLTGGLLMPRKSLVQRN